MHPGDQIDPGASSRAVLPHQRVNLAGVDIEADLFQHHIAGERLRQITVRRIGAVSGDGTVDPE